MNHQAALSRPTRIVSTWALILALFTTTTVSAETPTTGYAPVNGLKMYYEVHGKGEPIVLLHGSFMTITNNWTDAIARLSKTCSPRWIPPCSKARPSRPNTRS